ncbi:TcpE family conjugal transfer membrane protein [Nonomuraea sp. NPDC049152]|uniref:TcpE family conjugal transfer membrane protein n=1 Tax=Nonomuraea sp. NPDC049152 TaxID=3154350 RepID=UPI0033D5CC8E
MDLPTYTNIWRIEKRLYKLYDLRLPMPLPIVWIGVFVGVLAPWSLLLWLVGIGFEAPWHVLYLVPPGIVTWLSTRPVIENKRLTELMQSQLRYMGEPRSWCRLTPAGEPETVTFSGRVWRAAPAPARAKARVGARKRHAVPAVGKAREVRPAVAAAAAAATHAPVAEPAPARPAWGGATGRRHGVAPALLQVELETSLSPVRQADPAAPSHLWVEVTPDAAPDDSLIVEAAATAFPIDAEAPEHVAESETTADGDTGEPESSTPSAADETAREDVSGADAPPARWGSRTEPQPTRTPTPAAPTPTPAAAASTPPVPASVPAKPIGTEALRRLRRLAATADAPEEAPTETSVAAPGTAQAGQSMAPADQPTAQAEQPTPPAIRKPEDKDRAGATLPELPSTPEPVPAKTDASERDPRLADDARKVEDQARDQHRKGQPPLTPAIVFQGQGKPAIPSIVPGKRPLQSPPERSAQPPPMAPDERDPAPQPAAPPAQSAPPLNIRAVQAPTTPGAAVSGPRNEPRVRRVESVVGRDSSGGWRRLAQVVVGGGGSRTDGSEIDEARTRAVFGGSRRVVVLGCTGGAGQSTTALMLGHTFAHYRDDRVLAVDASTGGSTLTSRIKADSPETLTSLLSGIDQISGYLSMRAFTTRTSSGLEVVAADTDIGAEQRLADRTLYSDHRLGQAMRLLDRHYKLAVVDPAPALAARVLPYADQLVLVVPASEDAAEAVAMTYEWLDGHGCADLRRRAVMVVNGVSRRSMTDVEQAEAVARGRCRAIVRVPWEDDLAQGGTEPVEPGQLRPAGRRAYLALAGVVIAGFASAQSTRPSEEEVAQ